MKKYQLFFSLVLIWTNLYSQNSLETKIDSLISQKQYQIVIDKYAEVEPEYSYSALYNVGLSYYMMGDDENCLKLMNLAIKKDSIQADPYFIIGSTYNYMNQPQEAIPFLSQAIALESDSLRLANSYRTLGYSYYQSNPDSSIDAYLKAMNYEKDNPVPYIMIAQLYSDKDNKDKALDYYYLGKENSNDAYKEYTTILFNIGLAEQRKENYKDAGSAYKYLLEIDPSDYFTYAKLIQVYNQTKEYDKIPQLKQVLYDAHNKGLIEEKNLSDMFCIDQFTFNDLPIKVYERYEEGDKDKIYNKIIFYILDNDNKIQYTIQTEYSPAAVMFKEAKYILCASKDTMHMNYGIGFDDETSYEAIKNTVIKILKEEQKADNSKED